MSIHSLGFQDIRKWVTLWRLILWSLGSTSVSFLVNRQGDYNALFDTVGASRIRGETFEILMMKVLRSPNLHTGLGVTFPKDLHKESWEWHKDSKFSPQVIQRLRAVYSMDHEVVPRPCKICDWLLNLSWDYFGLHQGQKCQSDHGSRGFQKTCFRAYIIHWHGPSDFAAGVAKRGALIEKGKGPWRRNILIIKFSIEFFIGGGREVEDKRRQKNGQTWISP